jgi:hyperosmotically inducible periplasmic protein
MRGTKAIAVLITLLLGCLLQTQALADEDSALATRVSRALVAAQIPNAPAIQVAAFNGAVDLTGVVSSEHSKSRATQVAGTVPGVNSVRNTLDVQAHVSDADDATSARVKAALAAAQLEGGPQITVATFNGGVELDGVVYSQEDKTRAGTVAGTTRGVTTVLNHLEVREEQ